jgi:cell division septation protein DedD
VNDSGEATHYQIELTSRQVLAALIVLLVCLFASFFAGVWIGRNAEADQAAHELARVDEVARGGERFDFFGKTGPPDGAAAPADGAAAPDSDLAPAAAGSLDDTDFGPDAEDEELLGDEGDQPIMADTDPDALFEDDAAEGDAALPPPEEMGRGGRRRRGAARAAEKAGGAADAEAAVADEAASPGAAENAGAPASTAPASTVPASPAPAAAPPAAAAESGFHIQVLATGDRDKAEALVKRLVDADFKAFIAPSNEGGKTVYRVRVGPFPDRAAATAQAKELETRWKLDSWISPGAS